MTIPFSPCPTEGGACSDASVSILTELFGSAVHKLATGQDLEGVSAATNTIASMLSVFNSSIMLVAGFLMTAITFSSVMNTANDGEIMGKNWSTPYTVMRMIAGCGALMPTASGYSIIQMMVLTISLWGIGLANNIYRQGVEIGILQGDLASTSAQMGITDRTVNESYALADLRTFAEGLTHSLYCSHVANATYVMVSGAKPAVQTASVPDAVIEESGRTAKQYWLADRNASTNLAGGRPVCGIVTLYDYKTSPQSVSDPEIAKLQALRFAVYKAKRDAMMDMFPAIQNWVNTWPSNIDHEGHDRIESNKLNEIVRNAEGKFLTTLNNNVHSDATLQEIMDAYVDRITRDGWMKAGGYYQRMNDIRGQITKMMTEVTALTSAPNLTGLPSSEQSRAMIRSVNTVPGIVFARALQRRTTLTPSDLGSIIQANVSAEDAALASIATQTEGVFSAWVNGAMKGVTATLLGTSGDVDAISRIKATGDILGTIAATGITADKAIYTGISAIRGAAAAGGSLRILGSGVNLEPVARSVLDWASHVILKPLGEVTTWLNHLAFYFGVFIPTMPNWIFLTAAVGCLLQVLQTLVAIPLWAIMHMTPQQTFIGSQAQGYLLLLALFVRPALLILGLFAAFAFINPILSIVTETFFSVRSAINADSYWFVQLVQLKNWLIVYGLLLLPIVFMVFGLPQTLPDAVLQWLNIGTSNLGHTDAAREIRSTTEKYGPSPPVGSSQQRQVPGGGSAGSATGGTRPLPSGGRGGGKAASRSLLSINPQGVTPSNSSSN